MWDESLVQWSESGVWSIQDLFGGLREHDSNIPTHNAPNASVLSRFDDFISHDKTRGCFFPPSKRKQSLAKLSGLGLILTEPS